MKITVKKQFSNTVGPTAVLSAGIQVGGLLRMGHRTPSIETKQARREPATLGDEEVRMQEGELWCFDNKEVHEAYNDGDQDRIHMIFDLRPRVAAECGIDTAA